MIRKPFTKSKLLTSLTLLIAILVSQGGPMHSAVSASYRPISDPQNIPTQTTQIEQVNPYLTIEHETLPDGRPISKNIVNGPSQPPVFRQPSRAAAATSASDGNRIPNFPSYSWVFGCGAVAGAMIAAHYDRHGYPNIYTGPTNNGLIPESDILWPTWNDGYRTYVSNPLVASQIGVDGRAQRGSIENYWVQEESTADDPYITNGWTQHTWGTALGDYTKTSQSAYGNADGDTFIWTLNDSNKYHCNEMQEEAKEQDIAYGIKTFYETRGYNVTTCYNQKTDNQIENGFSLADYKAEIDAGRPVLIFLAGHFVVGYGYNNSEIYIRDTWDSNLDNIYTMTWGDEYAEMAMLAVSIIHLEPVEEKIPLTVAKSGDGFGRITSTPPGIDCGVTCSASFTKGTTITLTATPEIGSTFTGWSGPCSGSGNTCMVALTQAQTVTATFQKDLKTLTVTLMGSGTGTVSSQPIGIDCGSTCSYNFDLNTAITLTATPDPGSAFFGWGGACTGATPTCQVAMTQSQSVSATFIDQSTNTFDDVSETHSQFSWIERLVNASITSGISVSPPLFGPDRPVSRAQMAIFLEKGKAYPNQTYTPPPASGMVFTDIPASAFAADWIEQLAADGITAGCGDGMYCPDAPVTRAQMAIFLLRSKYGAGHVPPAVGDSTGFGDVARGDFAAAWIKQLAAEGITSGCGGGNYCPKMAVTRAQMAVFLVRTFDLPELVPVEIPPDPIQNGGFESAGLGWDQYSLMEFDLIVDSSFPDLEAPPHSGSWLAWLGGYPEEVAVLTQRILIPAERSILHYWIWIGSVDICAYDQFLIYVDTDLVHEELLCYDNNTNGWVHRTLDLSAYANLTVDLKFAIGVDETFNSNVFLDDISIEASATYQK